MKIRMTQPCGCIAIRENNTSRIEYCELHASAPALAAEVVALKAQVEAMREACRAALRLVETELNDSRGNRRQQARLSELANNIAEVIASAALGGE